MYYCYLPTPIGELLLAGDNEALTLTGFPQGAMRREPEPDWIYKEKPFVEARRQLQEYFAGKRQAFDLALRPSATAFQRKVLEELQKIPYGTTCSYAEIAERIGQPTAMRAVGSASAHNPIPIIIPCHRVIGSGGELTGFGGGLETKEALLRHEMEHSRFPNVPESVSG